jgi:hypothetical protein
MLHATGAVHYSHLVTASESGNITDCAICVFVWSVMGQILQLRRGRTYGAEGITNRKRNSAASNMSLSDK